MVMRIRMLVSVLVVITLLAGCGAPSVPSSQLPSNAASSSGSALDQLQGPPVDLSFTASTVTGKSFAGSTLAGKPAVLWFWAPWCPICKSQIPAFKQMVQKYQGRLTIVAVGGLDSAARIRKADEVLNGIPTLVDDKGDVWNRFGVTDQATYVFLGSDGQRKWIGDDLSGTLGELIARAAG
jgi:thiol-disulfide isomerase/thioredoxin